MASNAESFAGTWVGVQASGLPRHTIALRVANERLEGVWTIDAGDRPELQRRIVIAGATVGDDFVLLNVGAGRMMLRLVDERTAVFGPDVDAGRPAVGASEERVIALHQIHVVRQAVGAE